MKKQYRFEILRRGADRFSWLFVVLKGRRRRVLARSTRDYPSAEKALQAIDRLRSATNVVDTTDDPFPLPATFFQIVPGVVPLIVEKFPVEDDEAFEPRLVPGGPQQDAPAAAEAAEEPVAAKTPAKPSTARGRRPAARRGSRATRGSSAAGGKSSASQ